MIGLEMSVKEAFFLSLLVVLLSLASTGFAQPKVYIFRKDIFYKNCRVDIYAKEGSSIPILENTANELVLPDSGAYQLFLNAQCRGYKVKQESARDFSVNFRIGVDESLYFYLKREKLKMLPPERGKKWLEKTGNITTHQLEPF